MSRDSLAVGDDLAVAAEDVLARCVDFLADALTEPPTTEDLDLAAQATLSWPLDDTESRRGAALLAESRIAGETPARLRQDYDRLFIGRVRVSAGRRSVAAPIASPLGGDVLSPAQAMAAIAELRRVYTELRLAPSPQPDHIAVVLDALAHALRARAETAPSSTGPDPHRLAELGDGLVRTHLLHWGARCLARMQRGAQTFYYQGLAAIGLGLLRAVAQRIDSTSLP